MRAGIAAIGLLLFGFCAHADEFIYWTDELNILRTNVDGSNTVVLVSGLSNVRGVAVDEDGEKIYWTSGAGDKIQRANLDGTGVEDILTAVDGVDYPSGIALDTASNKLYWNQWGNISVIGPPGPATVRRANLDGTNPEILVTDLYILHALTLDLPGGRMYWTDSNFGTIRRSFLDGTGVELVVDSLGFGGAKGVSLDLAARKVYWSNWNDDSIHRADMDGLDSNVESVVATGDDSSGIFIDNDADLLYWVEPQNISRSGLDGSSKTVVLGGLSSAGALVVASADVVAPGLPAGSPKAKLFLCLILLCIGSTALAFSAHRAN